MSAPQPTFTVALRHLSPDVRRAGIEHAEVKLTDVRVAQLRKLLDSLAQLAPKVEYPAVPEMRITGGDQQFLVQVREGHVRFSSWSVRAGGCDLTPAQILATIAGTNEEWEEPVHQPSANSPEPKSRRIGLMVVLAVGILGTPVSAWFLTGIPAELPPELRPAYRLVDPVRAQRSLERFTGPYETGQAEGDRRLVLDRDGTVQAAKFGAGRALVEETQLTVEAAESGGQDAFLASNRMLIQVIDPLTLMYLGDTYRRVPR